MIQATVSGNSSLSNSIMKLEPAIQSVVQLYGVRLLQLVRQNASGAPGPNVITGQYRASISLDFEGSGEETSATVYSDMEFGAELEYAGHMNHEAHPHFRPAFEEIEPEFVTHIERIVKQL